VTLETTAQQFSNDNSVYNIIDTRGLFEPNVSN